MFFKIYSVWQQDFFSLYLGCHFIFLIAIITLCVTSLLP